MIIVWHVHINSLANFRSSWVFYIGLFIFLVDWLNDNNYWKFLYTHKWMSWTLNFGHNIQSNKFDILIGKLNLRTYLKIILINHSNSNNNFNISYSSLDSTLTKLVQYIPKFEFIIDGHSHHWMSPLNQIWTMGCLCHVNKHPEKECLLRDISC
jgi:hypothetical protein